MHIITLLKTCSRVCTVLLMQKHRLCVQELLETVSFPMGLPSLLQAPLRGSTNLVLGNNKSLGKIIDYFPYIECTGQKLVSILRTFLLP